MAGLSKCLKRIGLGKHEAAVLKGNVKELLDDGYEAHKAATQAVKDYIADLTAERADIVAQIEKQIGAKPAAEVDNKPAEVDKVGPAKSETKPEERTATPVAESKAAPAEKKAESGSPEYDAHDAFLDRLYKGDVTADEIKAHFQKLLDSKTAIVEQLNALTKDKLLTMLGGVAQRYKSETKGRIVDHVYDSMLNDLNLSRSLSYSMGAGSYQAALKKAVDGIIQDDINTFAAKVAKQREERATTMKNMAKAVKDPKTLDDFHTYLRFKVSDGEMTGKEARMSLTPEQRATYDNLSAEKSRNERSAMEDLRKTDVRVAATTAEGQIVETKHTKSGIDLFVVKAAERVDRDVYTQWSATAKRLGGYYSSFRGAGAVPGFQFKTRANADAFLKFIGGNVEPAQEVAQARRDAFKDDRSQSAVERLNEMADKLEERADESLGQERKSNTARRARFAASAEAAAETNKALASTMRNIAKATEDGKAKFLNRVRQKSQVEMLRAFVRRAQFDELRDKYPAYIDQEKHKGASPTSETIDYAEFPKYTAFRSDLARLGRELEQIDGTKKLGAAILKVADDVTDTYLKFAKEKLHLVSTFGRSDGKPAIFASRSDAEESIKRSGLKGKAVVLPFKRNQNMIILSPSAAHEKGIWDGDQDKRITLTADAGAEIVAKVKAMGSRQRVSMPYIFENVAEDLARLKTMGIETPQEFRAALREFVGLRVATKAPDKIKEMERAMIGRRKDGLDFFPTPANVVQDMIDAADIQEGMSVLEPSAGMGHIADRIRDADVEPDVVELSGDRRELLEAKGYNVVGSDFLDLKDVSYDRIIMNPPFSDRRDMQHAQHAYDLLKPGGRLVAIMGEGVFFGQDKKAAEFRDWLDSKNGTSEKLDDGTFLDASLPVNTGVNARMVVIEKAAEGDSATTASFSRNANPEVSAMLSGHGIDQNLKEKAAALEEAGQSAGTFRITSGKLLDAVLDGPLSKEAREDLQAVKVLQDLFKAPVALVSSEGKFQFNGVYYDGTIWISADSSVSLPLVFGHELSHRMEADNPAAYNALLNAVKPLLRNLERYEALNSLEGYSDKFIQKEMLGDLLGDRFGEPEFWQQVAAHTSRQDFNKIITAIRMWIDRVIAKLRGLGSEKFVSDLDAARKIMAKAVANYAEERRKGLNADKQDGSKFSRETRAQTNTPEFAKWFGDSKVVDENGRPLVVYHGTSADISVFDTEKGDTENGEMGTFFTTSKDFANEYGDKVGSYYLSLQNPYTTDIASWNFKDGLSPVEARAQGYDGYVITGQDGGDTYLAFRPEQIKSAIGNRGTFDPNDPNILFSRKSAETTEPANKQTDVHPGLIASYRQRAGRIIDRIDKALDPLGNLPESREYLAKRYLTLGRIAKVDEIAKGIGKAFDKATADDKQSVYDYLTTRDAAPKDIKNDLVRAEAVKTKRVIDSVGDALEARGLLDPDTREAHRGAYLPRLYLKHLLSGNDWKALGAGKKPSDMGYLKKRADIPEEVRKVILGEITDPGFLAATAIAKPARDMALLDFLSSISKNEKWVLPNSMVEFDGASATPQFLRAEAERLRKQADHYAPEDAKKARGIADRMDTAANKALGDMGAADLKNYKEVPNTARYGRLRGLWVRKEIYEDLVGAYDLAPQDPGFVQSLLGYGGIGTKITQLWKMGKVALNPPSQVRNFVSNGVLLQLSGVPLRKVPVYLVRAAREIANNGKTWLVAKKYGVTESTFSTQELYRIKRDLLDLEMREGKLNPLGKLHRIGAIVADAASDAYQFSEAMYKTAKIMHAMDSGMSEADAAIEAQKWLFDYSLVPQSVRYLRNAPIGMPFLCVDEATEALTKDGWKGIDEIKEGDMIASFGMQSQRLEWKPVSWVYRDQYDGPMVHVQDRHLDMLLTPHHRCVSYRKRRVPGGRADNVVGLNLEIVTAADLNVADHIPVAAIFDRKPEGVPISDAMVRVLAWVATEGYLHPKCAQVRIYQNLGKSQPIRDALAEAGMTWSEFVTAKRVNGNDESVCFSVHAAHGRRIREFLPNKKLTPALLNRLTSDQIDILIETMIDGDGCRSGSQPAFIQKKGETAESFKMALVMAGRSFGVHDRGNGIEHITIRDGKRYCVKRALNGQVPYKGRIWCPEVPGFTTWVARRNGKVFITGNTFQYKVLPRIAEVALLHPQRLIPWVALFAGMPLLWATLAGEDDDEYEKLQKALPTWLQERGHAMILPVQDEDGRWQVVDLGYFMPWSMYTDILGDVSRGEVGEAAQTAGIFSGPLTSVIVAMKTGKDSFTGRDIVNPGDPVGRQFAAGANYAWDMMMPPIVSSRGLVSPMGIVDPEYGGKAVQAITGRTNKYGEPTATGSQAALYPFGLNVYSIEPKHSAAQNALRFKYEADQTEMALKRKLQNRGLSEDARRAIVQEYTDELKRRYEKVLEYKDVAR